MVSALSWGLHDGGRVPVRTITGGVVGLVAGFESGPSLGCCGVFGFNQLLRLELGVQWEGIGGRSTVQHALQLQMRMSVRMGVGVGGGGL